MAADHNKTFLRRFFLSQMEFPEAALSSILESFFHRELKRGEIFLQENQISNEYLIVQEGILRSYIHNPDGEEITTGLVSGPGIIFEPASFFTRLPSREIISAVTPVAGWAITFDELNRNFHLYPEFREFGRALLIKKLIEIKQSYITSITASAEQRYGSLLETQPQIIREVPLKYIASYLGITDTSLSRIRRELSGK